MSSNDNDRIHDPHFLCPICKLSLRDRDDYMKHIGRDNENFIPGFCKKCDEIIHDHKEYLYHVDHYHNVKV